MQDIHQEISLHHARPYQADQGGGRPRPYRVPLAQRRDEEGRPEQALRLEEVRVDQQPQGWRLQGGNP